MAESHELRNAFSEEAEQAVLSAILIDRDALARVRPLLKAVDLFALRHQRIYSAMLALEDRGDIIDPLTLSVELERRGALVDAGGKDYIGFIVDAVPTAANIEHHAAIVLDKAKHRGLVKFFEDGRRLLGEGALVDDVVARIRPALESLATGNRGARGGPLQVRSDAEIEQLPAMQWLASGILPLAGLFAVYGDPEAGKSFIALDLAFCIATGAPWLGRSVVQGGTLYCAAEGVSGLSQRVVAWKASRNLLGHSVGVGIVSDAIDLLGAVDVARVIAAAGAAAIAKPVQLIVIDTLARAMAGGDENDTRDMSRLIASADQIRHATGAAVLLVHHTGKASDDARGSSALRGAVDTMILCEDGDDGRQIVCRKQKDAAHFDPIPFRLVAGHGSCTVQASGSGSSEDAREHAATMTLKRFQVLRVLRDAFPGARGATSTEWMKATHVPERTFYRVRGWLVDQGYVSESARGRYTATPVGRTANCQTTAKTDCQTKVLFSERKKDSWQPQNGGSEKSGSSMAVVGNDQGYLDSLLNDAGPDPDGADD